MDPDLLKEKPPKETRAERIERLTETLETRKKEFTVISEEIFRINQEFNTKSEESKHVKASVNKLMKQYMANNTETALKEAELALKQQILQQKIELETDITNDKRSDVDSARNELQRILAVYSECKKNLFAFENNVTEETDEARMAALNHVAFLKYAQSTIMAEVHKISDQSYFPTRKEAAKIRDECIKHVDKSTKLLRRLYQEKLIDFRRHERILTGRRKELIEQEKMKDMKLYENIESHLIAATRNNPMFDFTDQQGELNLPDISQVGFKASGPEGGFVDGRRRSNNVGKRKFKAPQQQQQVSMSQHGLPSMTMNYDGSIINVSKKLTTPSASIDMVPSHQRHANNLLYDFSNYEYYSHPDHMKYGTLLSTIHGTVDKKSIVNTKQLQEYLKENDDYLVNLALTLSAIQGKQKELTAIKEGLDIQLIKQSHLALNITADMYRRVGLKLPEPLKMQPKAYVVTPQTLSSQKDVKDIIKDKNIAEGMSGAIAGQYRYAFDPNLDIKECSKDIISHEQLLAELNYQTKELLQL